VAKMTDTTVYVLPEYTLPYLVNGDPTNLLDWELENLQQFEADVVASLGVGSWSVVSNPYYSNHNDLTSAGGDVAQLTYTVVK